MTERNQPRTQQAAAWWKPYVRRHSTFAARTMATVKLPLPCAWTAHPGGLARYDEHEFFSRHKTRTCPSVTFAIYEKYRQKEERVGNESITLQSLFDNI